MKLRLRFTLEIYQLGKAESFHRLYFSAHICSSSVICLYRDLFLIIATTVRTIAPMPPIILPIKVRELIELEETVGRLILGLGGGEGVFGRLILGLGLELEESVGRLFLWSGGGEGVSTQDAYFADWEN